jgi:excisionase family DNA binding protein
VKQTHAAAGTFITIGQTADYLGVNPRTVRDMIRDGRLKAYHLGHRVVRLRIADVDAALQPYGGVA